jgi:histidinol dehydrogenase
VGIAALAYGTESIRAVHKIVGPGNAFVAEAKRQLFGRVGIDSIAGPSEVLIIADDSPRPEWIAADLMAQAEHNPGSAILVTTSQALAEAVSAALEKALENLTRATLIRNALKQYGAAIVTRSLDEACEVANDFATEHLQIMTRDNAACLAKVRHGGAIFVGQETPVPLGDYYTGPSHVLPTGGTAKFFGPLSSNDFLKASSLIEYDAASLNEDAADVIDFATREGLTAHASAVRTRTTK